MVDEGMVVGPQGGGCHLMELKEPKVEDVLNLLGVIERRAQRRRMSSCDYEGATDPLRVKRHRGVRTDRAPVASDDKRAIVAERPNELGHVGAERLGIEASVARDLRRWIA